MLPKRQIKRFTAVNSHLRWQDLRRLASGCQGDYILASTHVSSLRLPKVLVKEPNPMEVLETGLPVMYYHPKSKSFENRIVKIDQQLSFLYVLQQGTQKEPSAVRLYGIEEVLSSTRALQVLADFDVQDEFATESTAIVVIHTRGKDPGLTWDKVMIFLAPPSMRLVEHISGCVELSKTKFSAGADDVEGVRLKDTGRYLDAARIASNSAVFFHYTKSVELEFTLRPADVVEKQEFDTKKPITHLLHFPMEAKQVGTEINKLAERLGVLPALDLTRLCLVVYEMVLHRQWISAHMRLFPGGLYEFTQDRDGLNAVFNIDRDVQHKLFARISAPRRKLDVHFYSDKALSATVLAMQHLVSLEEAHAALEKTGVCQLTDAILEGFGPFTRPAVNHPRDDPPERSRLLSAELSNPETPETWEAAAPASRSALRRDSGGVALELEEEWPHLEEESDTGELQIDVRIEI